MSLNFINIKNSFFKLLRSHQVSDAKKVLVHALLLSFWWCVVCSIPFWNQALNTGSLPWSARLQFAFACGGFLILAYSFLLILLNALLPSLAFKIIAIALALIASGGATFSITLNVAITPEMVTNALQTDARETYELISLRLVLSFLALFIPCLFLTLKLIPKHLTLCTRAKLLACALLSLIAACGALFTDFSSAAIYMREHHEARYYLTPSNVISSYVRTLSQGDSSIPQVREVVEATPSLVYSRKEGRPVVVVTVVGETTRAKNWGLSGYSRNTTPELAKRHVINFADMNSCGTDTATSVPCIFSKVGRRDYSRSEILKEEPLPAVIQRAGIKSLWIDNQSGSKGASDGIDSVNAKDLLSPDEFKAKCQADSCYDGIFPQVLNSKLANIKGSSAFYLHLMGSHGPTYRLRYEEPFNHWGPVCEGADLRQCSLKELRNAYDNSILYTDHVLSELIDTLKSHDEFDTLLVFFSDHGESLGENGFFLHGAPYAISPDVQTKVPMIMWFSEGFKKRTALDEKCLRQRASRSASHDNMWSTLMGLNGVQSTTYNAEDDLLSGCVNGL